MNTNGEVFTPTLVFPEDEELLYRSADAHLKKALTFGKRGLTGCAGLQRDIARESVMLAHEIHYLGMDPAQSDIPVVGCIDLGRPDEYLLMMAREQSTVNDEPFFKKFLSRLIANF